jgi:hypothetical protein
MTDRAPSAEPEDRPQRRRRAWLISAAAAIALLVGFRLMLPELAGAYLREQLAAAGLPSPRLTVASVGLHHLSITGLQLGTDDEVTVGKVAASYDPASLLHGRIQRLELRGVRIKAGLAGRRISLGSLDRALGGNGAGGAGILPAQLSIADGVLSLKLPDGLVAASFAGEFDRAPDARLAGQLGIGGTLAIGDFAAQLSGRLEAALGTGLPALSLQLDLLDPRYGDAHFAPGRLKLVTRADGGSFEFRLGGLGDPLELSADGQLSRRAGRIALTAKLALAAKPGAPIWPLLRLPQPQQGALGLAAELAGSAPEDGLDWRSVTWRGSQTAHLDQLSWPGLAADVSGTARLALSGQDGTVTVALPADLRLEGAFDEEPLQAVPGALRPLLAGRLLATLQAGSRFGLNPAAAAPLVLDLAGALSHAPSNLTYTLRGSGDLIGFKGDVTANLVVPQAVAGALAMDDVAIDLGGTLSVARGGAALQLGDGHRIAARRLTFGGAARLDRLVLPLQPGAAPLLAIAWPSSGGSRLQHSISIGPVRLAGLKLGGLPPGTVDVAWQGLTSSGATAPGGYSATAALTGGSLAAPQAHIAASGLSLSASLAADGSLQASLRGARVVDTSSSPAFVPLRLQASAALAAGKLDLTAALADEAARLRLGISARHDLASAVGAATLSSQPLAFDPAGLQPRDLSPAFGRNLQEVSGTLRLGGKLSWKPSFSTIAINLILKNVSGRSPELVLQQLNGVVSFDRLWPPTTPPHQQLSAQLADVGLPLTDVLLDFQLLPGPELAIAGGSLRLAGGDVVLDPVRIGKEVPELRLKVHALDLKQLLALASIEGLDGSGSLSGEIPVTLDPAGFRVKGGRLEAAGPGRLSYAPGKPPPALQGGGESVSLALAALTDFRYDELRTTLDREANGQVSIGMHVRGKNPGFYNGYPVVLNFTLNGELDRILRRGLAGYRIPDSIREKLSTFGE